MAGYMQNSTVERGSAAQGRMGQGRTAQRSKGRETVQQGRRGQGDAVLRSKGRDAVRGNTGQKGMAYGGAERRDTGRGNTGQRAASQRKAAQRSMRKRQRRRRAAQRLCVFMVMLAFCLGIIATDRMMRQPSAMLDRTSAGMEQGAGIRTSFNMDSDQYFEELEMLLELNEETADFVADYANREEYKSQPIDLAEDFQSGQVPLLMQWDRRWGYNAYGDSMIGLSGCGPVCLTMAYLYFTEDTDMTPREMALFAYENGYYTEVGTSWSLWTEGVEKLGLSGSALSLDENVMKRTLDGGGLIICSMRPGDFTAKGHFILIRGYDQNGFYVNDPNRRSNSAKQWDFDTLSYQIKNLWAIRSG